MPAAYPGPATLAGTKAQLSITDSRDDLGIQDVVDAVNARVRRWDHLAAGVVGVEPEAWPHDTKRGADMLAARLFRRKDTPAGVASFGEGGAVYVMRTDPDVALLLRLGPYAPPQVG